MDKSDKEIQELLQKFLMLAAFAKDDSKPDPLPVFAPVEKPSGNVTKIAPPAESRFPALRAKLAKAEQQTSEETNSSEE